MRIREREFSGKFKSGRITRKNEEIGMMREKKDEKKRTREKRREERPKPKGCVSGLLQVFEATSSF